MRTPVPKCLDMKRNWCGTGIEGKRLTTMGKEQAGHMVSEEVTSHDGGNARTSSTQDKDENQGEDMDEGVVVAFAALGLALWPFTILLLSSEQLSVEDVGRELGEVWKRNIVSMRQ